LTDLNEGGAPAPPSSRLAERVALITGVSSGIGAACARRFAAEGATIVGLDVSEPDDAVTAFASADVRDEQAVVSAVAELREAAGRIDILVNAAGVSGFGPVHMLGEDEWDRVLDINLKGTYLVSKHVLPAMLEQRSGAIVHLASMEGLQAMEGLAAYNASKGGVVMLTKQMAMDYGRMGIRVNCLCPGFIDTPMTAGVRASEELAERIAEAHALGRFGAADEVAACAAFLASDDASFVTGHALLVDGGFTAGHGFGLTAVLGLR
jgi:NAD(P)-dependent dehydrogenase (short-subunit alcohol dehydrogenase family)